MKKVHLEKKAKVSVVIPIYNVEKYLCQCLESICKQTLNNIEIICVNDGSTDKSLEIIQKYAKKDKRIKIITGENAGYGSAVNKGFAAATGEYISLIESDDFILPSMYEEMYDVCEKEGHTLDFVKSDTIRFYGDGKEDDCNIIPVIANSELYDVVINPIEMPEVFNAYMINTTGLYKTSFIKENHILLHESKGASYQDNGLWFQLFIHAKQIMFMNKAFYMYRMDREESSTNCMSYEKAFCIFDEWEYIHGVLNELDFENKKKYLPVFIWRCYGSLFYHFTRILDDYRILYLRRFSDYMKQLKISGELDVKFLLPYQQKDLLKIMDDPLLFFYNSCVNRVNKICEKKIVDKITELNNVIMPISCFERSRKKRTVKISVIIPVYNAQTYLQNCLDSILQQTLYDIEVICIDDGSTDNSLSILLLNMKMDDRVVVFKQENQGAGVARNKGLKLASGEFVAFMDADDFYYKNTVLEQLYDTAKRNKAKICGGNFAILENKEVKVNSTIYFAENRFVKYEEFQEDYGYTSYIFELDMLLSDNIFFPEYKRFQDPPFFVKAMIKAGTFFAICDVIYVYRFIPSHVKWNEEKISDLIRGITDCIEMSNNHKLAKLHYQSVMRLESSYSARILNYSNNNPDIIRLLVNAEEKIDVKLCNEGANKVIYTEHAKLNVINKMCKNENLLNQINKMKEKEKKLEEELLAIRGGLGYKILFRLSNKYYKPCKNCVKKIQNKFKGVCKNV